jgi:hypothetical protein
LADIARPAWTTVSPKLVALYKEHGARNTRPSFDDMSRLLLSESSHFSKLFVVIDAIDECSDSKTLTKLLKELNKLRPILRLMVTGRWNIRIDSVYPKSTLLSIKANEEDIRTLLDTRINEAETLKSYLDENLNESMIKNRIVKKADGM